MIQPVQQIEISLRKQEMMVLGLLGMVSVIWGLNVIMIKYLAQLFPVVQLGAWRISIAAVCLLIFTSSYWMKQIKRISWKVWGYLFGIAFTSIFGHQIFLAKGVQITSGSVASLILALNPLTTALLAMAVLNEKFEWKRFIGIGLGFFGVVLVVGQPSQEGLSTLTGDLIVFISMLAYVAGGLLIKKAAEHLDIYTITTFSHVIGAALLMGTWLFISSEPTVYLASTFSYAVMIFSGCVGTALCTTWWNKGIQIIGPSRTTLFLNAMPLSSLVFAVIFLGESLHWSHFAALLMIMAGIYLGVMNGSVRLPLKKEYTRKNTK